MLRAYVNYPEPHITLHADSACGNIKQQHKQNQRRVLLEIETLSTELRRFADKEYRFGATPETNDLWLELEFANPEFERSVVEYIHTLLGRHYKPFARIRTNQH